MFTGSYAESAPCTVATVKPSLSSVIPIQPTAAPANDEAALTPPSTTEEVAPGNEQMVADPSTTDLAAPVNDGVVSTGLTLRDDGAQQPMDVTAAILKAGRDTGMLLPANLTMCAPDGKSVNGFPDLGLLSGSIRGAPSGSMGYGGSKGTGSSMQPVTYLITKREAAQRKRARSPPV
jgi:hypothetical protein